MKNEKLQDLYNIVTLKNIDDEDFIFSVDNQQYVIRAGETRNFPRFMASLAVKHLIDRILTKMDDKGTFVNNKMKRAEIAEQIVVDEQHYEKPIVPTDDEIVDEMNSGSDIDEILKRNRKQPKPLENLIPPPKPKTEELESDLPPMEKTTKRRKPKEDKKEETTEEFAGLIPPREEMLKHARNVLKMDVEEKDTREKFESLSDAELFKELGMDKEL